MRSVLSSSVLNTELRTNMFRKQKNDEVLHFWLHGF